MAARLSISFEGAARTVTGSRHRILFGDKSWLFDCGLYQGHREEADRVNRTFRFDPIDLDHVVLSHAHLDHSGNVPTLVSRGYPGRVHVPPATGELCKAMLADSAFLMERDVDHVRKHRHESNGRRHGDPIDPLYTVADAEAAIARFDTHPYHDPWELMSGVTVRYYDAGHILGAAVTTFEFQDGQKSFRLCMGGDLGRPDRPILRDPEVPPGIDVLVLESTYGNRLHPDAETTQRELVDAITRTVQRGGRVLVPAFAIGRAQELVATLHELMEAKLIPSLPMYVDSPLASQATDVFKHHPELFDEQAKQSFATNGEPIGFARLRYTRSADESRALNEVTEPIIIIAASGMCEGGRILHHLRHGLGDPRNTVLFVGYQAEGTLGRRIRDGAEVVSVFGEAVHRRAEVRSLDGFSAHADQAELVGWVGKLQPRPKMVFLVHGDFEPAGVLAEKLTSTLGVEVQIPSLGERFDLWN